MRLKELRLKRKLTQTELANELKLKQRTIANYETGTTKPSFEILKNIANYFNVSIDYLLNNNCANFIDASNLSRIKQNLITLILNQSDRTCERLEAMIFGYLNSYEETRLRMQHDFFNKKD